MPTEDRCGIEWNGAEKFYDYTDWLQYIMDHFLKPWGFTLSGEVSYQGEDASDRGKVVVVDGVTEQRGIDGSKPDDGSVSEDWVQRTRRMLKCLG